MDNQKIKDKIINFVRNSPEEVNSKVAVYIAAMRHARKNPDYRPGVDLNSLAIGGNGISTVKNDGG